MGNFIDFLQGVAINISEDTLLTGIISTISGVIIGGILGYLTHGKVDKKNRKAIATVKFRETFLTELKELYPTPSNWPDNIEKYLTEKFPALQSAVAEFRNFVPWYRRKAFDTAWYKFYHNDIHKGEFKSNLSFWHYTDSIITTSNEIGEEIIMKGSKYNLKKIIDKILSYAHHI